MSPRYQSRMRACSGCAGSSSSVARQDAVLERERRLWVRHLDVAAVQDVPAVAAELAPAAVPDGGAQVGLGVVGEELPRRARAPLLAHEEHRAERGQQDERGLDREAARVETRRRAVAQGAVAHLVVRGRGDDEPVAVGAGRDRPAPVEAAERRERSVVQEHAGQDLVQHLGGAEVAVVPVALAGDQGVEGVVHVVVPLGGHAPAALGGRRDRDRVVQVGLGDQRQRPSEAVGERRDLVGQLREQVPVREVDESVHGIEPQGVRVEVAEPAQDAVADPPPDLVGVLAVEVDGRAPRRLVRSVK